MVLRPDSRGLYAAREQIRSVVRRLCIPPDEADCLLIAVGEAISNAYRHGTPDPTTNVIRLSWRHDMGNLRITVKDSGSGFHAKQPSCASERLGSLGLGIGLMRACTDNVHLSSNNGARVVLHKRVKLLPEQ